MSIAEEDLERQLRNETRLASTVTSFDILLPEHFVSIMRGVTYVKNTGARRECRIEILTKGASEIKGPAAVFGCRAVGWFDTCEVALLNTGKRILVWKRKGKQAEITIDGKGVGRIELGWSLQHTYIGSGSVWFAGEPFCEITLPVFGPSSPQPRDCTGSFTFANDRSAIKFVISPKDAENSNVTMKSGFAWGWARLRGHAASIPERSQPGMGSQSDGTIFYLSDQARLTQLSNEQRLILLSLAVWPWALYKGGGT